MATEGDTATGLGLNVRDHEDEDVAGDTGGKDDAVVYFTPGRTDIFTMSASVQRGRVVNR